MVAGHASIILKSNPERRFHFFGGIGFEGGMSFRSRFEIDYVEDGQIIGREDEVVYGFKENPMSESENHSARRATQYAVFLPFGASIRFSKKHQFFSKLNFFLEMRSLIYYNARIDDGNYSFSSSFNKMSMIYFTGGYGLRYKF